MIELTEIRDGIWTFPIVLPDNPLKWLNCYVIMGGERNLLIDTGFRRPECQQDLLEGMERLGLTPENTDVFLSHTHADHTGNAALLQSMGYNLFMSAYDYALFSGKEGTSVSFSRSMALSEGMSSEIYGLVMNNNPALKFRSEPFTCTTIEDGDVIRCGMYRLECIWTPGHTPGHLCLYDRERKIMFLGDHVLFDITPNICSWANFDDSLGAYIESLHKMRGYDVELALPAHRNTGSMTMYQRIDQLLEHHQQRLAETERIIKEQGETDAYSLSGKMTWRIRSRSWEDFPPSQKWFAFSETLAHLDYLVKRGRVEKRLSEEGKVTYLCS